MLHTDTEWSIFHTDTEWFIKEVQIKLKFDTIQHWKSIEDEEKIEFISRPEVDDEIERFSPILTPCIMGDW